MENLIGQIFGGYELKEVVGAGGMASIFKGYDDNLSRWVAIKIVHIPGGEGAEETMLKRFRLEAQAIAALRHRNILTIYSYGEEKGWAYIVMEYVPGGSLKDRIEGNKIFTWQQALTIVIPVSQALAFAHERKIIHRDIKPANILMPQDDWPLLADFGLAKMQQNAEDKPNVNLTMPGQVLGTMAYAAPEQIQEGAIDHRVDIYSLGIVFYELLTGQLPFRAETAFEFLMARLTDPPIPLLKANPHVPKIFAEIIDKALTQEPDDRYQMMEDFSQALMKARYELSQSIVTPLPGSFKTSPDLAKPTEAKVRLKVSPGGQEILATGRNELIVGRAYKTVAPDIDLAPYGGSKAGVSRRHGRLIRQGNKWLAEDLGSINGTFVNGVRLDPNKPKSLSNGDLIRFGKVELVFSAE